MKQQYRLPAVYRWVIYEVRSANIEAIYIGEAQVLCPNRLNNYLKPGPTQQTSKRINALLKGHIAHGQQVLMEILDFKGAEVQDFHLEQMSLSAKSARRFLEEILVTFYRLNGMKILNL